MRIMSKRRLKFRLGSESFVTAGGNKIETAPDWVRLDPYFNSAQQQGIIDVFAFSKRPVVVPVESVPFQSPTGAGAETEPEDEEEDPLEEEPDTEDPLEEPLEEGLEAEETEENEEEV